MIQLELSGITQKEALWAMREIQLAEATLRVEGLEKFQASYRDLVWKYHTQTKQRRICYHDCPLVMVEPVTRLHLLSQLGGLVEAARKERMSHLRYLH